MERDLPEDRLRRERVGNAFDLVVVCTGNRARSPTAEGLLRALLAEVPVRIRSLGTLDVGSLPPLRQAVHVAHAYGIDIRAHRSRCLRQERLAEVDLVVGFERAHLAAAIDDCGASRERVFSMPELVDLVDAIEPPSARDPVARAREAVARAHALRLRSPAEPREIADPLGGPLRLYRETIAEIHDLSVRLAVGLFGSPVIRTLPAVAGNPLWAR